MISTTTKIKETLAEAGIKPSAQRIAVVKYLEDNCGAHPTVDEIFRGLEPMYPTLSRTTVYNTVRLLCENGRLTAVDTGDEARRYDINLEPHAHFICSDCNRVFDIPMPPGLAAPHGFAVSHTDLCYHGICPHCAG